MKLQPLIPLWLLIPYVMAVLGSIGWLGWRHRARLRKERALLWQWLRRAGLLVLPVLIALGPSVQGGTSAPGVSNLDIILAVDTTPSMGALDYAGTQQRIAGVRKDLLALATSLQGAHFEIISFDSEANIILPPTNDLTTYSTAVQNMTPQISNYSPGSTIDKPVKLLVQELKNDQKNFPEHYRLLYYLGDGEQTASTAVGSFDSLARYLKGGAVLGYGTTKGAKMIKYTGLENANTQPTYITTVDQASKTQVPATSNTNPTALKKIASQLKVTYLDRNQAAGNLYKDSKAQLAVDRSQHVIHYLNLYWLFALPYAGLIFWEWQNLVLKLWDMRDKRGAKHA